MKETMGQIIRRLRKERNLTQDELAEQLGVTFQAVSKWENDTGMPDISQVIPLATVFNVSTDVLFGICGRNDMEEVNKIIEQAESKITYPLTRECIKQQYDELQKGLEKYPNNTVLLSCSLEAGISLAYPENDIFDANNGENIYKECVRQANIRITLDELIAAGIIVEKKSKHKSLGFTYDINSIYHTCLCILLATIEMQRFSLKGISCCMGYGDYPIGI